MTTVGMIGTGTMGGAMVGRLLEAGHDVVIHDARREAAAALEERGARWVVSPAEVGERCRLVLSSLPGPAEVEAVTELLLTGARPGDVHAGLSTVSVDCARRVAERSASRYVRYLDAPVSGGTKGVTSGTLAVLASGDRAALTAATPVLHAFAARIFDLGPDPGAGTLAKLVNNAIFLCSGLVHQEAVVLATRSGIDPDALDGVLAASSANMYLGLGALTLSRQWDDPFFTLALAEKDIALALESARVLAVPMPVISAAHQHYLRAVAHGLGDQLCLATLAVVEEAAGIEVPARPAERRNP
jgi:3-hydroxyisobutyrate dehydrogenase